MARTLRAAPVSRCHDRAMTFRHRLRGMAAALLLLTLGGLVLGIAAAWAGNDQLAFWAWTIPAVIVGVRLAWSIVRDLLDHEAGVDIIALLAIAGAVVLGESFAAAVIAVMLA